MYEDNVKWLLYSINKRITNYSDEKAVTVAKEDFEAISSMLNEYKNKLIKAGVKYE